MASVKAPTPAGGFNPTILVDPDLQTEQARVQRAYDLAQALREQSMQNIDGNGGKISWTQGLAKLMAGWAAREQIKRADTQQGQINRRYAAAMRPMFGMGGAPQPQPGGGDPTNAAGGAALPTAAAGVPPRTIDLPGQGPVPLGQDAPVSPQAATGRPIVAQPAPQQRGPWSLTDNPQADFGRYMLNPDEYGKAVIANAAKASAPTDREIAIAHIQEAISRGDLPTAQALMQGLQKDNYIAPVSARPGSVVLDPRTNKPVFATPQNGQELTFDANGTPNGVRLLNGAAGAAEALAGAEARGKASQEPITAYDAAGNPVFTNKANAAAGGYGAGGNPGRGPGPIQNAIGGGGAPAGGPLAPAPRPGFADAAHVRGEQSAAHFADLTKAGTGSQDRVYQLGQISRISNETRFGPGSQTWANLGGYINRALGGVAGDLIDPRNANNTAEFTKYATQLAANQASALGLNGTDAKFDAIMKAVPNPSLQNGAIKDLVKYFRRNEYAIQMRANASAKWAQQHGPDTSDQFESAWRNSYNRSNPIDGELYAWVQAGPEGFQRAIKSLPIQSRDYAIKRYTQLRDLGAFGQ